MSNGTAKSTSVVVALTKAVADKATPIMGADGKARAKLYLDRDTTGFGLLVGAKRKTFIAQRYMPEERRAVRVTIGRYGVLTLDQARRLAKQKIVQMEAGENPLAEKRKKSVRGATLRDAWRAYEKQLEIGKRSLITRKHYREYIERYLAAWLDQPLVAITREEVQKRYYELIEEIAKGKYARRKTKIVKVPGKRKGMFVQKRLPNEGEVYDHYARTGETTANHTFKALRAVFNHQRRVWPTLDNPTAAIQFGKAAERRNPVPRDKLAAWYAGVHGIDNPTRRDVLLFCLFTGMRSEAARSIKLADINIAGKSLRVPDPKGGTTRAFDLPLSTYLVALIKKRVEENAVAAAAGRAGFAKSPYLFAWPTKEGYLIDPRPKKNKEMLDVTYEVADGQRQYTTHDLRDTFITVAESIDIPLHLIQSLVNHRQPKGNVTLGYVRHEANRLQEPMQKITDYILSIVEAADLTSIGTPKKSFRQETT